QRPTGVGQVGAVGAARSTHPPDLPNQRPQWWDATPTPNAVSIPYHPEKRRDALLLWTVQRPPDPPLDPVALTYRFVRIGVTGLQVTVRMRPDLVRGVRPVRQPRHLLVAEPNARHAPVRVLHHAVTRTRQRRKCPAGSCRSLSIPG